MLKPSLTLAIDTESTVSHELKWYSTVMRVGTTNRTIVWQVDCAKWEKKKMAHNVHAHGGPREVRTYNHTQFIMLTWTALKPQYNCSNQNGIFEQDKEKIISMDLKRGKNKT